MSKQLNQAVTLAQEYRVLRDRGAVDRLQDIREAINALVARYDGEGSLVLPQSVEEIMGVDVYGSEISSSKRGVR